jgi:hypothetical protein
MFDSDTICPICGEPVQRRHNLILQVVLLVIAAFLLLFLLTRGNF